MHNLHEPSLSLYLSFSSVTHAHTTFWNLSLSLSLCYWRKSGEEVVSRARERGSVELLQLGERVRAYWRERASSLPRARRVATTTTTTSTTSTSSSTAAAARHLRRIESLRLPPPRRACIMFAYTCALSFPSLSLSLPLSLSFVAHAFIYFVIFSRGAPRVCLFVCHAGVAERARERLACARGPPGED